MDQRQFPNQLGFDIPIGQELTISGQKRDGYEAGIYFGEERQPSNNINIPGIYRYFDGSTTQEPGYLNVGRYHQHTQQISTAARIVSFTIKKFQNGFHEYYAPGHFIFALNKISPFELSTNEFPSVHAPFPSPNASVGVTPIQLRAILFEAEKRRWTEYQKEQAAIARPRVEEGLAVEPPEDLDLNYPLRSLYNMNEIEWSERDGSKVINDDNTEIKKRIIKKVYETLPSIGWCNGSFLREHIRLLGIIEHIQDATEYGRVDVSVAVCGGSHTLNYWGPYLENGDRTMFTITKTNVQVYDPGEMNPFRISAFRNPMIWMPGIPLSQSGKSGNIDYVKTEYIYGNQDRQRSRHPPINFKAGYAVRRDPIDYAGLAEGDAVEAYAKQCMELLGPDEMDDIATAKDSSLALILSDTTARVVYLHVSTSY